MRKQTFRTTVKRKKLEASQDQILIKGTYGDPQAQPGTNLVPMPENSLKCLRQFQKLGK